ncbi:hypothetical protein CF327_g2489 [Tilletia walkeri]|nr:hypothetical protein CF327_g2489 [Tilletia walkeri]
MHRTAVLRISASSSSRAAQSLSSAAAAAAAVAGASASASRPKFDDASATLSPGLLDMIRAQLGPKAKPTHVQELCLQHFFPPPPSSTKSKGKQKPPTSHWLKADAEGPTETLIAAETGSGKTLAYLLPLLQHLKATDRDSLPASESHLVQPRAIILAPTHELARQLAGAAKNLCHVDKLKVLCLSSGGWLDTLRAGVAQLSHSQSGETSDFTLEAMEAEESGRVGMKTSATEGGYMHPDIIVSTPSRLLSTLANAREVNTIIDDAAAVAELRRTNGRPGAPIDRHARAAARKKEDRLPLISLANVRSVVIDEADVLLAPDFGPGTRAVLHLARKEQEGASPLEEDSVVEESASSSKLTLDDITAPHPNPKRSKAMESIADADVPSEASSFPFDLVLATATIPTSLASYLRNTHPNITTLASNRLHKLPSRLKADFVNPGGNKMAAIAGQIRKVLTEAPTVPQQNVGGKEEGGEEGNGTVPSKVLIFMNRSTSVELLSKYLTDNGISNVAVTSSAGTRSKKSNAHIKTFLRETKLTDQRHQAKSAADVEEASMAVEEEVMDLKNENDGDDGVKTHSQPDPSNSPLPAPRVLITTSLLSRGLDFDPSVTHVFLPDRISYSTSGFGSRRLAASLPGTTPSSGGSETQTLATAGINELELLHRAGRAARAGSSGKVVIFDKRAAVAASRASGGGSDGGRKRKAQLMIRNKEGKYVPRAAEPLRKAVRGLLVPKKRAGSSSSRWEAGTGSANANATGVGKGRRGDGFVARTAGGSGSKSRPALPFSKSSSRSQTSRAPSSRR